MNNIYTASDQDLSALNDKADQTLRKDLAIAKFDTLTVSEREVAIYLANGSTNQEIATYRTCSVKTVDTHRQHIMAKLGTRNNASLALKAVLAGLVIP